MSDISIRMAVRDYECDLQGIVNNAVYLNYFEHARYECLHSLGLDFAALHSEGIDPVVARIEVDYFTPLTPGDEFDVSTRLTRKGRLKFIFDQEITTIRTASIAARARVTAAFLVDGRPDVPPARVLNALEGIL